MKEIRNILAVIWSFAAIGFITYILCAYGKEKEILTLVIGIVGNTIVCGIFGFYFMASHKNAEQKNIVEPPTEPNEPLP